MKEKYEIDINRPYGVSVAEMKDYLKDAIDSWGGQFHFDDPLFDNKRCKVRRIKNWQLSTQVNYVRKSK